ncbi:hypothetical protein P8605_07800 [Streptomyces sp. T-3]|nr:hypothetical protein [Streptomyces sp. T-3]
MVRTPGVRSRYAATDGGLLVDASTVVAICATFVAVASLVVSVHEGRASRQHNRLSVRPLLQLDHSWRIGQKAGLRLTNAGLGPAIVVRTVLTVDGNPLGGFTRPVVDGVRETLPFRPSAVTFTEGDFLRTDHDSYLLSIDDYDPRAHEALSDLITRRLSLEIWYESLYGGERYRAVFPIARPG